MWTVLAAGEEKVLKVSGEARKRRLSDRVPATFEGPVLSASEETKEEAETNGIVGR